MTQDTKQQIVDQDAYDKAQILLHKAYGGEVECLSMHDKYVYTEFPLWNFGIVKYRIVGPSRAPFDPIQHMNGGGALLFDNGVAFKYIGGVLHYKFSSQPESNWRDASSKDSEKVLSTLVFKSDDAEFPKPYQEPEKPVVWCNKDGVEFHVTSEGSTIKNATNSEFNPHDEYSHQIILEQIAQGKWERVYG